MFGLSVEDAAKSIGISRNKIFREIREGRLTARKIGRRTIVTDEDLRAYLSSLPTRTVTGKPRAGQRR